MIDSKYALQYSMPHSVVHIVDNSEVNNTASIDTAYDPSLLSTIVVTGAPMGEDNKIISLTRSDVVEAAFGAGGLTPSDVKKYGQSVTYALDLIRQGVPVQFMRVTPPDSTYAVVSLIVQYKTDNTDGCLHVRFVKKDWPDVSIPRDNFKNTSRLNEALVSAYKASDVNDDNGDAWSQLCLINYIAAGRGKIYDNMSTTINLVSQSKRPANAKYQFTTIDNRTGATVETFYASLMNTSVGNYVNSNGIDAVNTVVSARVPGSSIVIPYLNEEAVNTIYKIYMEAFKEKIDNGEVTAEQKAVYNTLNINTFDLIFGKYLYNGTSADDTLPFYVVEMETSDLPKLDAAYTLSAIETSSAPYNVKKPEVLREKLIAEARAVRNPDSEVFVGDVFITRSSTGSAANPKISIITGINQYTGRINSMMMPKLYVLNKSGYSALVTNEADLKDHPSRSISFIITDATTSESVTTSEQVAKYLKAGTLTDECIVVQVNPTDNTNWTLYQVEKKQDGTHALHAYPDNLIYDAFDRSAHSNGVAGTGNAFGFKSTDKAWTKAGCGVVKASTGSTTTLPEVYINTYDVAAGDEFDTNRIIVNRGTGKRVGAVPSDIKHDNISGTSYDVKVYDEDSIEEWRVASVELKNNTSDDLYPGENYKVGDLLYLSICDTDKVVEGDTSAVKTVIRVDSIDEKSDTIYGGIKSYSIVKAASYLATGLGGIKPTNDAVSTLVTLELVTPDDSRPAITKANAVITGIDVTKGAPRAIYRYTVSGSQYSLYSILSTYDIVPNSYYGSEQGINPSSTDNTLRLSGGDAGFFDSDDISDIEYKWKYSALLVQALRGEDGFDRRILSPTRVPAKFMFDGGFNTIVGSVLSSNISSYTPEQLISASIIFTDDEKSDVEMDPEKLGTIGVAADIDVKAAMYDLMIQRVYDGIPEEKRPIGPGSGFQVYFDSGVTDADTTTLVRESFLKRFDNPNAIWDIGGFVEAGTGISYTYVKHIVEDLFRHINAVGINKPYAGKTTAISKNRFTSFFPDLDTTDWAQRETIYTSGGNAWILGRDGSLERKSQVTLKRDSVTSDLLQENNMRTLSRLIYLLQDKIDSYLLNYNSDSVLKSLQDEVNNMFSNWTGNYVDGLDISFERDKNTDGADILVCYVNVTFRGLILRVPIIVNVNSRQ